MENENNLNQNNNFYSNPTPEVVVVKNKLDKKTKILIIAAFITLVVLLVYYFMPSKKYELPVPPIEQKVETIKDTMQQTAELGLPKKETQADIMKYNLEN